MGVWEFYARVYDSLPKHYRPYQRLLDDVTRAVEACTGRGSKILDAGCGTGNFSIQLSSKGFDVEGIDSSHAMLERARSKKNALGLDNIQFRESDIEKGLPFYPDSTFDCVLSVHTLFAFREPEKAIAEYFRVLKPSGWIIMAEPKYPIRIGPIFREIYRDGGLPNMLKLLPIHISLGVCNLVIGRRLKKGIYHYWDEAGIRTKLEGARFRMGTIAPAYAANSDLLVTAVKPGYYCEMNRFRFLSAQTQEDLEKTWRLRYQVYCLEIGFEPKNQSELERDVYDQYAMHFLAVDDNNRAVGTMRLVRENPKGYPLDPHFPLTEYVRAHNIPKAVEGSRFVIHKDVPREDRGIISFGLFKCAYDWCSETGVTDVFTITQSKIAQKYSMTGLEQIGEPFEYTKPLSGGLWVPMRMNVRKAYENYLKGGPGHSQTP
jgi:ubiquinone/menaquinone biosynthesis C-methylase UbiE/N-acyl-L-homoserine lactone synthetase